MLFANFSQLASKLFDRQKVNCKKEVDDIWEAAIYKMCIFVLFVYVKAYNEKNRDDQKVTVANKSSLSNKWKVNQNAKHI